jgi:hypothetical protein
MSSPETELAVLIARLDALVNQIGPGAPRWLPIDAAANYSGLSAQSLRRLLAGGKLVAHRPVPGRVLIDRRALDALIGGSTGRPRSRRGRRAGGREGSGG